MRASLRRDLGLLDAVGIGVGAIIGAGIFVVLGVAAGIAGPSILVGLVIAGVAASANALSSAQLAAVFPFAGGTYEYGYRVLNPWAGYIAGWMFLASKTAAAGTVALGLGGYLGTFLPATPPRLVGAGAIAAFTALGYFGVRRSSVANLAIIAVSVGSLVLFCVAGAPRVTAGAFRPFAQGDLSGMLEAAALLFFAYTGYARVATLGEEVREPERTIPRAIMITIGSTLLLYRAVAVVAIGTSGADALAATAAPLAVAARAAHGEGLALVVAAGGVAAMLGVVLSQVLGLSRMTFAMARRGDLPSALERVHPRYGVPHRAMVLVGVVAIAVTLTGSLKGVAEAAAFTILIYYGLANLAAYRMPERSKLFPNLVPLVGMTGCAVLALSLPIDTIITGLTVLTVGLLGRVVFRRRRTA